MKVEDFTLQRDDDGNEFLTFAKGPTKTRQGGLNAKTRLVNPKMFATGNEETCPVMLFKRYLEKRPSEMQKSGPFYLIVIEKPVSSIWYKKTPMGKNTINTIMKNMTENSPLKHLCPEKNLTNHSARKTVVKKLKSSGIPKCEIKRLGQFQQLLKTQVIILILNFTRHHAITYENVPYPSTVKAVTIIEFGKL